MAYVYRIEYAPEAPRLEPLEASSMELLVFDGRRKAAAWPAGGLKVGEVRPNESLFQFYYLAPGVLAYPEELVGACEDFYWVATQNIEPLRVVSGSILFSLLNIIEFMEPLLPGEPGYEQGAPCNVVEFYAPIIRIRRRDPTELYCVSGVTNPMNEFKAVYERYGFKGLEFREIWKSRVRA